MKLRAAPTSLFLLLAFFTLNLSAQVGPLTTPDFSAQQKWVDSLYSEMTPKERIGQLLMLSVESGGPERYIDSVRKNIRENHIGGVIFSRGTPKKQAILTNEFQEITEVPLLIGMDAEWGLAMRLDSTFALPWNMSLGAIQDEYLIEKAGAAISRHAKRLGVHINFAPVVDINTNPENPIIGNRSFGETKQNVTNKSIAFLKGMQREGIIAVAKHFPGHGDTDSDSHKTLPSVSFSGSRIKNIELYPYRELIARDISGVMAAHLNVPAFTKEKDLPSSLSKPVITDLLKKDLGFKGLVFTDALNMKGASNHLNSGDLEVEAFLAGNDVLLMPEDVPAAVEKLNEAYQENLITEERLEASVKKILAAKYKAGLYNLKPVDTSFLYKELNTVKDSVLFEELTENAITLVKNNSGLLPIKDLDEQKIAYVNFGDAEGSPFLNQLRKYAKVDWVRSSNLDSLLNKLEDYTKVIIGFHKPDRSPWSSYKFSENELTWIQAIARSNETILSVFTRPYALLDLKTTSQFEGILLGYQNNRVAQQKTAQVIFGGIEAKGKLSVSLGNQFPAGTGYFTPATRLAYGSPESVGLNSYKLRKIDTILREAIDGKMAPGVQMLVARKGKVVFQRNVGYHTYEEKTPVTDTSVYDLASVTKILATLPLVMQQVEEGVIDFDTNLGELIPSLKNSNKEHIRLQDMLMHYARFKSWIPFYVPTIDPVTKKPSRLYYKDSATSEFSTKVADEMYIRNDMQDTIVSIIRDSELEEQLEYRYSDLPFYLLKYYLENYYDSTLHKLTQEEFYKPLGSYHTGYLPIERFSPEQIVPTEIDKLWRRQKVQGYVHDQGAAMQGGIGGHAGLFSNANDVAKIMQMYLNGGSYGGDEFFKPETISKFNTCYYCEEDVRRGVGFDKPQLEKVGPTCGCVSMASFGHSGFTGTLVWADPVEEIVYVFLSNRTFPDSTNRKLIREDIRSRIQEVIYESIDF
ncbi:glycoside hydrolase family 3 N-terminal domain-containing protein [Salegentibacter chungangensis]|uniref:beta-N-acetylhexosaminidase n=1 Tax=Salegentibacter chungangensis TaxID=1335724 RepID=A0ABW3NV17_9FLAO